MINDREDVMNERNAYYLAEFHGCRESLDLLGDRQELERVLNWLLTINRFGVLSSTFNDYAVHGGVGVNGRAVANCAHVAVETRPNGRRLTLDIYLSQHSAIDEQNAQNVITDLRGLFDPAEHHVEALPRDQAVEAFDLPPTPRPPVSAWRAIGTRHAA